MCEYIVLLLSSPALSQPQGQTANALFYVSERIQHGIIFRSVFERRFNDPRFFFCMHKIANKLQTNNTFPFYLLSNFHPDNSHTRFMVFSPTEQTSPKEQQNKKRKENASNGRKKTLINFVHQIHDSFNCPLKFNNNNNNKSPQKKKAPQAMYSLFYNEKSR